MKRFVLAVALTGLMSVTVLAGEYTDQWRGCDAATANNNAQSATSSTLLTNVVLTIITTLIGR